MAGKAGERRKEIVMIKSKEEIFKNVTENPFSTESGLEVEIDIRDTLIEIKDHLKIIINEIIKGERS